MIPQSPPISIISDRERDATGLSGSIPDVPISRKAPDIDTEMLMESHKDNLCRILDEYLSNDKLHKLPRRRWSCPMHGVVFWIQEIK